MQFDIIDLIFAIVNDLCLVIYVLFLLNSKSSKNYFFVYDAFYLANGDHTIKEATLKNI